MGRAVRSGGGAFGRPFLVGIVGRFLKFVGLLVYEIFIDEGVGRNSRMAPQCSLRSTGRGLDGASEKVRVLRSPQPQT